MPRIKATIEQVEKMLNNSSSTSNVNNKVEALPEAIDKFKLDRYFKIITNHGGDNLGLDSNGLYVFCDFELSGKFTELVQIASNVSEETISGTLFDFPPEMYNDERSTDEIIRFNTTYQGKDRIIGAFHKTKKSLIVSDLTHNPSSTTVGQAGFSCLEQMLNYLIEKEYIIPAGVVSVPTEKTLNYDFNNMTFGCDPEFEFVKDGHAVSFTSQNHPNISHSSSSNVKLGADGAGCPVEVRPGYSTQISELINYIKELFATITDVHLSTVGNQFAIGGHIHIGFGAGKSICPSDSLLQLLDYFVGRYSMMAAGTARTSYNHPSRYETKPYGFEYRTPSASTFTNPKIAELTIRVMRDIIVGYMKSVEFMISTGMATADELKKYTSLSDEEIAYYTNFYITFKNSYSYSDNVISQWVGDVIAPDKKKISRKPVFSFSYFDTWSSAVKLDIDTASKTWKLKGKGVASVVLFGWKQDRGAVVSGITIEGYETLTESGNHDSDGNIVIGLPFSFRRDGVDSELIIEAIHQKIKEYFIE